MKENNNRQIQEIYEKINNEILSNPFGSVNNKNFRAEFKKRLEKEMPDFIIKCDEENNPPEIVQFNCLITRVLWVENETYKYCDLIFGQPEQVKTVGDLLSQLTFWRNY